MLNEYTDIKNIDKKTDKDYQTFVGNVQSVYHFVLVC